MFKKVYEAQNSIEAHMLANLLEQNGIHAQVQGEYLQGGIGELPASGLVKLVVEEQYYDQAVTLIRDWEKGQPVQVETDEPVENKKSHTSFAFLMGVGVGALMVWWIFHYPVSTNGIDYNKDGLLDEKFTYNNQRLMKIQGDRNYDGQFDVLTYFDYKGQVKRVQTDDDFDGRFETETFYKRGYPETQKTDIDNDGKPDHINRARQGVWFETEIMHPTTGLVRKRQYYEQGKLKQSEYDSDADGIMDVDTLYDYYENIKQQDVVR